METYKITVESKKNGVVFDTSETYVTTLLKPKIGDGRKLLTDPPTFKTIVKVEKVDNISTHSGRWFFSYKKGCARQSTPD